MMFLRRQHPGFQRSPEQQRGPARRGHAAIGGLVLFATMIYAAATQAQEYHRPRQVAGVTPCPNATSAGLQGPRTVKDSGRDAVELQVKLDVDVDGAPNAYGPRGRKTLDVLRHSHAPQEARHPGEVVGYMTEYDGGPPTVQGKGDPYPGYYVSQTDFADRNNKRMEDPRRYVDATRINYVVLGRAARRGGVVIGDFVKVYSCRTGRTVFAIVADSGNEGGEEGSLALVNALGYKIHDGVEESVNDREIVIHYFPKSNPQNEFFKTQTELDLSAQKHGLHK